MHVALPFVGSYLQSKGTSLRGQLSRNTKVVRAVAFVFDHTGFHGTLFAYSPVVLVQIAILQVSLGRIHHPRATDARSRFFPCAPPACRKDGPADGNPSLGILACGLCSVCTRHKRAMLRLFVKKARALEGDRTTQNSSS